MKNKNIMLVQFYPQKHKVGYIQLLEKDDKDKIKNYYDHINASDYYHESIVLEFNCDSKDKELNFVKLCQSHKIIELCCDTLYSYVEPLTFVTYML